MFDCKNILSPNQICTAIRCRLDDTDECCKCQAVSQQDLPGQQLARSTPASLFAFVAILGEMSILIGCRITKQHQQRQAALGAALMWPTINCANKRQSYSQTPSHTQTHITHTQTQSHTGAVCQLVGLAFI